MKKGDKEAMMANLKAQGILTVVSISTNGAVEEKTTPATAEGPKGESSPRGRRQQGGQTTLILG